MNTDDYRVLLEIFRSPENSRESRHFRDSEYFRDPVPISGKNSYPAVARHFRDFADHCYRTTGFTDLREAAQQLNHNGRVRETEMKGQDRKTKFLQDDEYPKISRFSNSSRFSKERQFSKSAHSV